MHVVEDRNDVPPSCIHEVGYIVYVGQLLEAVANHEKVLADYAFGFKRLYQVQVECRRCLQMDVVLHGLPEDKLEMRTLGAVAVVVRALVVHFGHCHIEHSLGFLYLGRYFGQVSDFQRCAILVYYVHHIDVMEIEFPVLHTEFVLREFKSLVNQIDVLVLHFVNPVKLLCYNIANPSHPDVLLRAQIYYLYSVFINI